MTRNVKNPESNRNTMYLKDKFALMKLVESRYTASGMNDGQFAEMASGELGLTIVGSNVAYARKQLEIPSNYGQGNHTQTDNALAELAERVAKLEASLASYRAETELLRESILNRGKK